MQRLEGYWTIEHGRRQLRALILRRPNPITSHAAPLEAADVTDPTPADGEVQVRVSVCGVCRTDLDVLEWIVAPRYP